VRLLANRGLGMRIVLTAVTQRFLADTIPTAPAADALLGVRLLADQGLGKRFVIVILLLSICICELAADALLGVRLLADRGLGKRIVMAHARLLTAAGLMARARGVPPAAQFSEPLVRRHPQVHGHVFPNMLPIPCGTSSEAVIRRVRIGRHALPVCACRQSARAALAASTLLMKDVLSSLLPKGPFPSWTARSLQAARTKDINSSLRMLQHLLVKDAPAAATSEAIGAMSAIAEAAVASFQVGHPAS